MGDLPALLLPLGGPLIFQVEVSVRFDAGAERATLEVVDYAGKTARERVHAEHLAEWVRAWGGWNRESLNATRMATRRRFGWTWGTSHVAFSARVARIGAATNSPGPSDSWYQLLSSNQDITGQFYRSQTLTYRFLVSPPL